MDRIDEFLTLLDLEKALKPIKYDRLNLFKLDDLRIEVGRKINKMKREGKKQ